MSTNELQCPPVCACNNHFRIPSDSKCLNFGKLSLVSGLELLPPRDLLFQEGVDSGLAVGPEEDGPVGVLALKLGLAVVDGDEIPAAAGEDVHVGFQLPGVVEGAGDEVCHEKAAVCVVIPQAAAAEGALGDGLADF